MRLGVSMKSLCCFINCPGLKEFLMHRHKLNVLTPKTKENQTTGWLKQYGLYYCPPDILEEWRKKCKEVRKKNSEECMLISTWNDDFNKPMERRVNDRRAGRLR